MLSGIVAAVAAAVVATISAAGYAGVALAERLEPATIDRHLYTAGLPGPDLFPATRKGAASSATDIEDDIYIC